jgi:hypothetical protein
MQEHRSKLHIFLTLASNKMGVTMFTCQSFFLWEEAEYSLGKKVVGQQNMEPYNVISWNIILLFGLP